MAGFFSTKSAKDKSVEQTQTRAQKSARQSIEHGPETDIMFLQSAIGNRAVGQMLGSGGRSVPKIQTKLTINQPGDQYEQEADHIADQVVSSTSVPNLERKCACGGSNGECEECRKKTRDDFAKSRNKFSYERCRAA